MLLLDFQRYYIWLKVYYTGTFGQWPPQWRWYYCYCITAQHQTILLLTLGREQWSSGTLEHWNTGTQHKRVRGMVHGKNPDGICRLLWENWAATLTLCCLFCPTGKTTFLDTSNDHYITDLLLWNVS